MARLRTDGMNECSAVLAAVNTGPGSRDGGMCPLRKFRAPHEGRYIFRNEASLTYHVEQMYISHWLSTNADWRTIGSWREPLRLALHCAIPRSSDSGWA